MVPATNLVFTPEPRILTQNRRDENSLAVFLGGDTCESYAHIVNSNFIRVDLVIQAKEKIIVVIRLIVLRFRIRLVITLLLQLQLLLLIILHRHICAFTRLLRGFVFDNNEYCFIITMLFFRFVILRRGFLVIDSTSTCSFFSTRIAVLYGKCKK